MTYATRILPLLLLCALPVAAQDLVPDDDVPGVLIAEGYDLRLGVDGLTFPSNLASGNGRIWISESGFFPGSPPTVQELTLPDSGPGAATVILTPAMLPLGIALPPFTDVTYRDGMLWLAHRQTGANGWAVGAISRFDPDDPAATFETVITNLPSVGDHQNNTVVFGADGRAYFGQGTATNSAVVGPDNVPRWVVEAPGFREMAPVDITLNGSSFTARVPTSLDPDSNAVTAPYRPFDSGDIAPGVVIPAATPATPQDGIIAGSGAVYSFDPDDADPTSTLRLEAWGLRNPFGLSFDPDDPARLFISNNGSDIRGQAGDPNDPLDPDTYVIRGNRPIAQDEDDLFVITTGGDVEFFGWPDFLHDPETRQPLDVGNELFCDSPVLMAEDCPQPIFDEDFRDGLTVEPAVASVGLYVSVTGFEPSMSEVFGFESDLFVTKSGSFSPQTGAFEFTGYSVSRIGPDTGEEAAFVVNDGDTADELFVPEKLNKPVSAVFLGDRLAIVDLGVLEPGIDLFQTNTGKVWLVERRTVATEGATASAALAIRSVHPNPAAGEATVAFELAEAGPVRLALYDVLGREVTLALEGPRPAGPHTATVQTAGLASGVYVVRLAAGGEVQSQRITVTR